MNFRPSPPDPDAVGVPLPSIGPLVTGSARPGPEAWLRRIPIPPLHVPAQVTEATGRGDWFSDFLPLDSSGIPSDQGASTHAEPDATAAVVFLPDELLPESSTGEPPDEPRPEVMEFAEGESDELGSASHAEQESEVGAGLRSDATIDTLWSPEVAEFQPPPVEDAQLDQLAYRFEGELETAAPAEPEATLDTLSGGVDAEESAPSEFADEWLDEIAYLSDPVPEAAVASPDSVVDMPSESGAGKELRVDEFKEAELDESFYPSGAPPEPAAPAPYDSMVDTPPEPGKTDEFEVAEFAESGRDELTDASDAAPEAVAAPTLEAFDTLAEPGVDESERERFLEGQPEEIASVSGAEEEPATPFVAGAQAPGAEVGTEPLEEAADDDLPEFVPYDVSLAGEAPADSASQEREADWYYDSLVAETGGGDADDDLYVMPLDEDDVDFAAVGEALVVPAASTPAPTDPAWRRVEEVADRLERIAHALRERGAAAPLVENRADPLGALITGYLLGFFEGSEDRDRPERPRSD